MPDYSKTKIYRIVCEKTGKQYVGSTIQTLSGRLGRHMVKLRMWQKDKKQTYYTSFPILQNPHRILLIENYPCHSKAEKEAREYYWIKNIEGGCVNKVNPTRTPAQWKQDNPEAVVQYNQQKREARLKRRQQNGLDVCLFNELNRLFETEEDKEIKQQNRKEYYQQYYEDHQNKMRNQRHQWYNENRQEYNEKRREQVECPDCHTKTTRGALWCHRQYCKEGPNKKKQCECGAFVKGSLYKHRETEKHKKLLRNKK